MKESMTRGEWWDGDAPYGPNGYQYGTGELVNMTGARVLREVTFDMMPGDPGCTARGVAELTDGRVYRFTVRKPEDPEQKRGQKYFRLASLSRQAFKATAYGLLLSEEWGHRVSAEDAEQYRREIDAL